MSEMWYTYWLACVEGITGDRKCELCRKNGSAEAVYYIEEKGENDLLRQFQQLGITPPKPSFTSQNTYSMLAMVSHNLGVCILPELVVRDISKNVVRLPLNPPMERVLGVRIPSAKKASPAASLLIAQLQRTVFELEGPLYRQMLFRNLK